MDLDKLQDILDLRLLPHESVDAITDEDLDNVFNEYEQLELEHYDDATIVKALASVKCNPQEPIKGRILQLCSDFTSTLRRSGYSEFISMFNERANRLLITKLYPDVLKRRIQADCQTDKQLVKLPFAQFTEHILRRALAVDQITGLLTQTSEKPKKPVATPKRRMYSAGFRRGSWTPPAKHLYTPFQHRVNRFNDTGYPGNRGGSTGGVSSYSGHRGGSPGRGYNNGSNRGRGRGTPWKKSYPYRNQTGAYKRDRDNADQQQR